jgi:hypothetical protein
MVNESQIGGVKPELLTHEQRAMWKKRHRKEMAALGPDEKAAFNKGLRKKLQAMSPAELAKTRGQLQAEWDALPAEKKEMKEQRIAERAKAAKDADK